MKTMSMATKMISPTNPKVGPTMRNTIVESYCFGVDAAVAPTMEDNLPEWLVYVRFSYCVGVYVAIDPLLRCDLPEWFVYVRQAYGHCMFPTVT